MKPEIKKAIIGYFPLLLFALLTLLYYYLDDYLDEGRPFSYRNSYGQGLATWSLDFEWFWGNFWLATIKACLLAGWLLYYANPAAQPRMPLKRAPWLWGLIIIIVLGFVWWNTSPNSPAGYNAGQILVVGWYPTYLARHLLELLLFASGFWLVPGIFKRILRKTPARRWNFASSIYLTIAAGIALFLAFQTTWLESEILILVTIIQALVGWLLFIFPIVFTSIAIFIEPKEEESKSAGPQVRAIDLLLWLGVIIVYLLLVLVVFWNQISLDIEVGSSFSFKNIPTWLYTACLALTLIHLGWPLQDGSNKSIVPKEGAK